MYEIVKGNRYLRFENSDKKAWIVPIKGMRTALNLYQPSGINGKLIKLFLPYIYWIPVVLKIIKGQRVNVRLSDDAVKILKSCVGGDIFDVAIFEGTPSVHKKATIQIARGYEILAYCKVSDNKSVVDLFYGEQRVLDLLHDKGVKNIPRCLYCGDLKSETLFVQSTIKTNRSKSVHEWTNVHSDFIENLRVKTAVKLPFAESDFAKSLNQLENYLEFLPENDQRIISAAIANVRDYYGEGEVEFCAYHGDFTPWNMFFENDELFVFDFEYAGLSYPPHLDYFHFLTQSAIFEDHLSVEQINDLLKNSIKGISHHRDHEGSQRSLAKSLENSPFASNSSSEVGGLIDQFIAKPNFFKELEIIGASYLLDIISKYVDREKGNLSQNTKNMIAVWCELLKLR